MPKKTPLQTVNDEHGGKEKLVDTLVGMLDRGAESKSDFRARLLAASNSKLLRLHETMKEITDQFGSKDKLVDAVLTLANRIKDNDYKEKLAEFTPVKLLGLYREQAKKAKAKKKVA